MYFNAGSKCCNYVIRVVIKVMDVAECFVEITDKLNYVLNLRQ